MSHTALGAFLEPLRAQEAQTAVIAVLILTLMDLAFGMLRAGLAGEFKSARVREGLGHKCVSLGIIGVGDIVDATIITGLDLGYASPVLTTACAILCLMEIASLMEIFAQMRPELRDSPLWAMFRNSRKEGADGERR